MGKIGKKGGKNEELMSKKKQEGKNGKNPALEEKKNGKKEESDLEKNPALEENKDGKAKAEITPGLFSILLFTTTFKK